MTRSAVTTFRGRGRGAGFVLLEARVCLAYGTEEFHVFRGVMAAPPTDMNDSVGRRHGVDDPFALRWKELMMRTRWTSVWGLLATAAILVANPVLARQQEPTTREQAIEEAQEEKSQHLTPFVASPAEQQVARALRMVQGTSLKWHPFFENAYAGGGFTLGLGYRFAVSPFNTIDVRGSYTVSDYKRIEAQFDAPRLFKRRGELFVLGGWREATQVGFYGIGTGNTSIDNRANYSFQQPYLETSLTVKPTRRYWVVNGTAEYSQWKQRSGEGNEPSVETVYSPANLAGLGATVEYLHTQGTMGFDWRTARGYSRRGGYYAITAHDYFDHDDRYGFRQVDYEAIQHVPILREAWVLSFRALAQTTFDKDGQDIPFFMLPSVGGGSTLRGFTSWRFRDRNSLLLQAEWRIMVNRFLDTAVFYDTGKVAARARDLDLDGLKNNVGFGVRFHGPLATPLRVEVARGNEGVSLVFSSSAVF